MRENENYWIDSNGNEWSKKNFTKKQASRESKKLVYCKKCEGATCLVNERYNEPNCFHWGTRYLMEYARVGSLVYFSIFGMPIYLRCMGRIALFWARIR